MLMVFLVMGDRLCTRLLATRSRYVTTNHYIKYFVHASTICNDVYFLHLRNTWSCQTIKKKYGGTKPTIESKRGKQLLTLPFCCIMYKVSQKNF